MAHPVQDMTSSTRAKVFRFAWEISRYSSSGSAPSAHNTSVAACTPAASAWGILRARKFCREGRTVGSAIAVYGEFAVGTGDSAKDVIVETSGNMASTAVSCKHTAAVSEAITVHIGDSERKL